MQQLRSALWDLRDRVSERGAAYPRWGEFRRKVFGKPKHRTYVILVYGTEEPDGFSAGPSISAGETRSWYVACCKGCRGKLPFGGT
jgi:hypothetical protein